jgi:hypothetical protein
MKNTLSDNNFFEVFYAGKIKAVYGMSSIRENAVTVSSRAFIGY